MEKREVYEVVLSEGNRLKMSIVNQDDYRLRSNSCKVPDLESIIYCLDFVPKLKPKRNVRFPSPMNLNARGMRSLKKNKGNKVLLDANFIYISCPEQDDIDSDSSYQDYSGLKAQSHQDNLRLTTKHFSKKFLEDEKRLLPESKKSLCREYEKNALKKENIPIIENFALDQEDFECIKLRKQQTKILRTTIGFKLEKLDDLKNEYGHNKLKAMSLPFESKRFTNCSILKLLELNIEDDIKEQFSTPCDA